MNSFAASFERFLPATWYDHGITSIDEGDADERNVANSMRRPAKFGGVKSLSAVLFVAATSTGFFAPIGTAVSRPIFDPPIVQDCPDEKIFVEDVAVAPDHWPKVVTFLRTAPVVSEPDDEIETIF
jgi:hypothetical protein